MQHYPLLRYAVKRPVSTVMACPLRWTRSPWMAQRTGLVQADACNPVSLLRLSRAAQ
jgi:hypothetical protein